MRQSALVVCAATILVAAPCHAQYALPLVSAEVDLAAFGIERVEDVVRGRLSVVYAPDGIRLVPHYLRDTPPTPWRPPPGFVPAEPRQPSPGVETPDRQAALWVWNTAEILREPTERAAFLDFLEQVGITRVFLYLASAEGARPAAGYIPFDGGELGPLLAQMRERGALAYALDGDRDYVLPENHAGVYRTVEALVAHNRAVPPEERFHGVRYDIEPYLAPGFQSPIRQDLLDGYVELLAGVSERARAGDLAVAVDIPFWFDSPDEETGAPFEASLHGERRPLIEHVMALVDDLAIMNYRTTADGPNGALRHAGNEMLLGEDHGVDVFVGVETTRLYDEDLHTWTGPGQEGLPTNPRVRWVVMERLAETRARFWMVDGEQQLAELSDRLDASDTRHWPAGRPARVPGDVQSFYALGADRMEQVTAEIVEYFRHEPAFVGLAYHDYLGMKELLGRR